MNGTSNKTTPNDILVDAHGKGIVLGRAYVYESRNGLVWVTVMPRFNDARKVVPYIDFNHTPCRVQVIDHTGDTFAISPNRLFGSERLFYEHKMEECRKKLEELPNE